MDGNNRKNIIKGSLVAVVQKPTHVHAPGAVPGCHLISPHRQYGLQSRCSAQKGAVRGLGNGQASAAAVQGGGRVVDLACGHGLLAQIMLILDQTSPLALAVDAVRAIRLRVAGYEIYTAAIPAAITPKNRLLMGAPCFPAR